MAEEEIVNQSSSTTPKKEENNNGDSNNKENVVDPELFSCLLQPPSADSDPDYIGIRRLLLFRKAESGICRRLVLVSLCSR